ncbi:hypothetical protein Tco_1003396 [Tanacetum coccineum]|uniref:Uncharacterized protein n=1 Tax=Tanacetum coccineum TaxID=301880 RepID=A0ABQ5F8Y7_9ASTR
MFKILNILWEFENLPHWMVNNLDSTLLRVLQDDDMSLSQQSTRNRGKAIVTSSALTYDPEPDDTADGVVIGIEAHYMYMAQIQEDETDDLDQERDLLASLIQTTKCEMMTSKTGNKFLEYQTKELDDKLKVRRSFVHRLLWVLKAHDGISNFLTNFVENFFGTVKFGNDQIAPIIGYGDLVLVAQICIPFFPAEDQSTPHLILLKANRTSSKHGYDILEICQGSSVYFLVSWESKKESLFTLDYPELKNDGYNFYTSDLCGHAGRKHYSKKYVLVIVEHYSDIPDYLSPKTKHLEFSLISHNSTKRLRWLKFTTVRTERHEIS